MSLNLTHSFFYLLLDHIMHLTVLMKIKILSSKASLLFIVIINVKQLWNLHFEMEFAFKKERKSTIVKSI